MSEAMPEISVIAGVTVDPPAGLVACAEGGSSSAIPEEKLVAGFCGA